MKLHKILSLALVLVLLFSLAACGKKDAPAVTTAPTTEPAGTTAPPETTVTPTTEAPNDLYDWIIEDDHESITGTVRFWSPVKISQGMGDAIEEFNKIYPNITVKYNYHDINADSNSYTYPISTYIDWGQVDVYLGFSAQNIIPMLSGGWFVDITDRISQESIDMIANWGSTGYTYDGKYYILPCGGLQYYVTINMTAWEEAGLGEIPTEWTWDEYIEASRKMTKTNEDGSIRYGGSSYSSINTILYCGAQVSGGDLYFNEDATASNYDDPVVIKAFERELNAELVEKIWFPLATYRNQGIKDYQTFLTGQVASVVTCNIVRYIHDAKYDDTRNFITAFAPFPTEEEGQTNYMSGVFNYSYIGITKNCADENVAWLFLKWFSTYGSKYLCALGHQSAWRGTNAEDIIDIIYGTEEEAAKYIDVDSFKHVIGRTDLPAFRENTSANAVNTYIKVTSFLKDPLMKALAGELTAEECLKQAAQEADAYIAEVLNGK